MVHVTSHSVSCLVIILWYMSQVIKLIAFSLHYDSCHWLESELPSPYIMFHVTGHNVTCLFLSLWSMSLLIKLIVFSLKYCT
jgi:hypothetical protein